MGIRRVVAAALFSLPLRCAESDVVLVHPATTQPVASSLLYAECQDQAPLLFAFDAEPEALQDLGARCPELSRILLLRFQESLEELELAAGELPSVPCTPGSFDESGCCLTRGLPPPLEIFEAAPTEPEPIFRATESPGIDLATIRYRRAGLAFRLVASDRRTGVSSLISVPWTDGRFLLFEQQSAGNRVLVREMDFEDARTGRSSMLEPVAAIEDFLRLSHVVPVGDGEVLVASFYDTTRRGPPSGPFSPIQHETLAPSELLVAPYTNPPLVYGATQLSGVLLRLDGDRWQSFSPPVPDTSACRQPAGRGGQEATSIWHDGVGYIAPSSGLDHVVPYPRGIWRVENDAVSWLEWPDAEHCLSTLAPVNGALWAGTRDGLLFELQNDVAVSLEVPSLGGTVNRIVPLTEELTLVTGEAGLLGVTDGTYVCTVPRLLTGVEAAFQQAYVVGRELLLVGREADHVKNVFVVEL